MAHSPVCEVIETWSMVNIDFLLSMSTNLGQLLPYYCGTFVEDNANVASIFIQLFLFIFPNGALGIKEKQKLMKATNTLICKIFTWQTLALEVLLPWELNMKNQ